MKINVFWSYLVKRMKLDTLNFFYDKVVEGGIIITDDYETPLFPGNKKAWQKFMFSRKISYFALPSGQAVMIKK